MAERVHVDLIAPAFTWLKFVLDILRANGAALLGAPRDASFDVDRRYLDRARN